MGERRAIDVEAGLESKPLGRFHYMTVGLCFLIVVVDGLDFGAGNVAAPAILKALKGEPSQMGLVFGWMYTGILLGSFIFGYVGDRFGRRVGAIGGVIAYSLPAIATAYADTMPQLMVLRFITGIAIGGVIPNAIALATENAPKRYRATLTVVALAGYTAGSALIAQVAAWYMQEHGWPLVFLVAGLAGTVLSGILMALLPESIRYLTLKKPQSQALRRQMRLLAPHLPANPEATYFLRQEPRTTSFSVRLLFAGQRRLATPLLWLAYFADSLTFMSLRSWLPVLLVGVGLSQTDAAVTVSYGGTGGIVVMLALARPLDRWGPVASLASATVSIGALLAMGVPGISGVTMMTLAIVATMCSTGTHNSLNGTVGIFYPTAMRSNGVGYASGMGRFAAIIGPTLTGYMLSAKLPLQEMLFIMAAPYVLVVLACLGLGRIYKRGFAPTVGTTPTEPLATAREVGL